MIDFGQYIKEIIIAELGTSFTIGGDTVNVYDQAPDTPSDNYIYQDFIGSTPIGTKDKFINDVSYVLVANTKVNVKAQSTILLNSIVNHVLENLVLKGISLKDSADKMGIYAIELASTSEGKKSLKGEVLLQRFIRLSMKCQQL